MPRLADYQRDKVRNAILTETFEARKRELVKREAALATKVILDKYGQDAFTRFAEVPAGWLPMTSYVNVAFGNHRRTLHFEESRSLPADAYQRGTLELSERLGRQLVKLDEDEQRLAEDRNHLADRLRRALRQFKTEAELRERWPEAHAKLAAPGDHGPVVVPAIRPADLNAEIERLRRVA